MTVKEVSNLKIGDVLVRTFPYNSPDIGKRAKIINIIECPKDKWGEYIIKYEFVFLDDFIGGYKEKKGEIGYIYLNKTTKRASAHTAWQKVIATKVKVKKI